MIRGDSNDRNRKENSGKEIVDCPWERIRHSPGGMTKGTRDARKRGTYSTFFSVREYEKKKSVSRLLRFSDDRRPYVSKKGERLYAFDHKRGKGERLSTFIPVKSRVKKGFHFSASAEKKLESLGGTGKDATNFRPGRTAGGRGTRNNRAGKIRFRSEISHSSRSCIQKGKVFKDLGRRMCYLQLQEKKLGELAQLPSKGGGNFQKKR